MELGPNEHTLGDLMDLDGSREVLEAICESIQVIYWGGRRGRPIGDAFNYLAAGLRRSMWMRSRYRRSPVSPLGGADYFFGDNGRKLFTDPEMQKIYDDMFPRDPRPSWRDMNLPVYLGDADALEALKDSLDSFSAGLDRRGADDGGRG